MGIRVKTLITLLIASLVMTAFLYVALGQILESGFEVVEHNDALANVGRVREAFNNEVEVICQKVADWAAWDDCYEYVENHNEEFVEANIAASALRNLRLDFMLFVDNNGELVKGVGYDGEKDALTEPPKPLVDSHFQKGSPLIRHANSNSTHKGVLVGDEYGTALFCSRGIMPTSGKGSPRGAIVFGRIFDNEEAKRLSATVKLEVSFAPKGSPGMPADATNALSRISAAGGIDVSPVSDTETIGVTTFETTDNGEDLVARVVLPRNVHQQALVSARYLLWALVAFGSAVIIVMMMLMEVVVLKRFAVLGATVTDITNRFEFSARVDDSGSDEISRLSHSINGLLAASEQVMYMLDQIEPHTPNQGEV